MDINYFFEDIIIKFYSLIVVVKFCNWFYEYFISVYVSINIYIYSSIIYYIKFIVILFCVFKLFIF